MKHLLNVFAAVTLFVAGPSVFAQTDSQSEVQQAETLMESGNVAGAVAILEKVVAASPKSFDARLALGRARDLEGEHKAARTHLEEAVRLASDEQRNSALAALGVSYAFESRPEEAARYYQRAFDARVQADDPAGGAGLANALGRVFLESGDVKKAEQWYTTGIEMARKIPGQSAPQTALWEMRWHHAQARIAARRGNKAVAGQHADSVRAALDKGIDENQRAAYPYLLGYIAFHTKDYRRAVDELAKGDQDDVFVLGLMAQAYEKLGEREKATEYFRKVMASGAHNINAAFARPLARAFLR